MVQEIWFEKSGSKKVVDQKKRWFYTIDPHFFRLERSGWPEKRSESEELLFLEPLFWFLVLAPLFEIHSPLSQKILQGTKISLHEPYLPALKCALIWAKPNSSSSDRPNVRSVTTIWNTATHLYRKKYCKEQKYPCMSHIYLLQCALIWAKLRPV